MKRLTLLLLAIICLNCKESQKDTLAFNMTCNTAAFSNIETEFHPIPFLNKEPYKVDFDIHPLENDAYYMAIQMNLANGAHFVSPNSKIAYKGRFTLSVEGKEHLELIGSLVEHPESVEEFDSHPFVNGKVNWVRQDTEYKQKLLIKNTEDFMVLGFIQFTIEPRCTLEKIPFVISQKDGKVKIEIDNC